MKSLKQLMNDPRVYEIERLSPDEFEDGCKYCISLEEGYIFKGTGSGIEYAENIADLNQLIKEIINE
jgi:hypothetical protein